MFGIIGSLVGGILGRNSEKKAIAAQNQYNDPAQVRARFEAAGFNPLLGIQPGVGMQSATGGTNFLGAAIADAGLALDASRQRKSEMAQLSALADQNQKLAREVQTLTIRPKVGGVYAQSEAVPALPSARRGANAAYLETGPVPLSAQAGGAAFGDAVKPEFANTYKTFVNDGQETDIALGPDLDEVISGAAIAANNKAKARSAWLKNHTVGVPYGRNGIQYPPGYEPRPPSRKKTLWDNVPKISKPSGKPGSFWTYFGGGFP